MKKKLHLLLLAALVTSLLTGCGGPSAAGSSLSGASRTADAGEKTMVIGDTTFNSENWEESVDPHTTYNGWACIRYGIGETLVHYSDNMELEPWLADSWENDGANTWTIHLHEGIRFSSGRDMDAEAVKECLDHLLQVHDRAPSDTKITDIKADGMTLTITTSEPNPALMNYLGDPYACIIDMNASDLDNGIAVGTGPYAVKEMVTDDHLTLVPNKYYWNGTPKLSTLTIRNITDGDTLSAALQSGDIDAAYGLAYESYPDFENDAYQFSSVQTSRAFFCSMNMDSRIMQDDAVRKAVAMGIDKNSFVSTLLDGHGEAANGAFPDDFSNFGGEHVKAETYNPDEAKKILEDAGWVDTDGDGIREKNGTKLEIRWLTYPSRQELPLLAEYAQAVLKEIGISVDINSTANYREFLQEKTSWDVYASALVTAPSGDPQYFFASCCVPGGSYNFGSYSNPDVTSLENQLSTEFDADKRAQLAIELQQKILNDNAYVFCSFLQMNMISRANVTGYTAHACDYYEVTADLDIS
ncbi:MAG: ABC transporter substrate-binding protein [Bilifractor sp.]